MKLLLACMFLAVTYAAADNIDCYSCYEGDDPDGLLYAFAKVVGATVTVAIPDQKCKENITESAVENVNPSQSLCTKLDFSATVNDKDLSIAIRTVAADGKCDDLDKKVDELTGKASNPDDVDFECNQCEDDRCNSASSIQMSLLLLASSLAVYFMRS